MNGDDIPVSSAVCICGAEFKSEQELQDHAREAHGVLDADEVQQFQCPECGSTFGTYDQLKDHWPAHGAAPDRPGHARSA
jgi:uncharacterized C2H2 Zn-finger protein